MEDSSAPATKQDIDRVLQVLTLLSHDLVQHRDEFSESLKQHRAEFAESLKQHRNEFSESLKQHREEVAQLIESVETKLLGAFFNYQEYDRIENRKFRADLSNVCAASDFRLDNLESRIAAIEKVMLSKPDHFDVHLVMDNYGTHKVAKVRSWLARHPRYHVHLRRPVEAG